MVDGGVSHRSVNGALRIVIDNIVTDNQAGKAAIRVDPLIPVIAIDGIVIDLHIIGVPADCEAATGIVINDIIVDLIIDPGADEHPTPRGRG